MGECRLCPRNCGVDREAGDIGYCGAGSLPKVARAALHFWEEPCISGDRGSGTVFFSYCSLRCVFCQNHEISQGGAGVEISVNRLAEIFLELQGQGAHNINLVTPTHYIPQIVEALSIAKKAGLRVPIVYNSSGYESEEGLRILDGWIDVYLPDVKFLWPETGGTMASCPDYFKEAMKALQEMFRQVGEPVFDEDGMLLKGMILRQLLLPSGLEETKMITAELFRIFGNRVFYSLMNQYTPLPERLESLGVEGPLLEKVKEEEYEDWLSFAEELGLENGFIQEGEAAAESFIPPFDHTGVLSH